MTTTSLVSKVLDAINNDDLVLPSLPKISQDIRTVLDDENSNIHDICNIIKQDPVLTSKVLNIGSRGVYVIKPDLTYAVSRIGMSMLPSLVDGLLMEQIFYFKCKKITRHVERNWQRSNSIGQHMLEIIEDMNLKSKELDPQVAYIVGLVSSIGELPFLTYIDQNNTEGSRLDWDNLRKDLWQNTAELGSALLKKWSFPEEIIQTVRNIDDMSLDSGKPDFDYGDILRIAYVDWRAHLGDHIQDEVPVYLRYKLKEEDANEAA